MDSGTELFGNFTPQPASDRPNGFAALAEFDKLALGGNVDGTVDSQDAIFGLLRLWQDRNHNGASEADEMSTLPEMGVESISLDYREAMRRDRNDNVFRYRAKVFGGDQRNLSRWAYDVFFKRAP